MSLPLQDMLAAGAAECSALVINAVLAIVDERGALAAYLRMDGAFFVSEELAVDKAWTAAGFRTPTTDIQVLFDGAAPEIAEGVLSRRRISLVPGGLPLMDGHRLLGGVGVSGGSADQDIQIAQRMIQAALVA